MRHCNGGRTVEAGVMLKDHCDRGGKLFVTLAGAASSFQVGVCLGQLIRAGKVAAISATGANMEESLYRLCSEYAYIPDYTELTRAEEKELDRAGFRRITDTFLPEDETVRQVLQSLLTLWREATAKGERLLWHEYFFRLFERNLIQPDPSANLDDCWLYQAWRHNIPVYVPGYEDSTMGNIFTWACYDGNHPVLSKYRLEGELISPDVVKSGIGYMHHLAEWYLGNSAGEGLAFVQLGGGIAADFPICVVPHLKKDYLGEESYDEQNRQVPAWKMFVEVHLTPMSAGSYSGAGYKEKITWSKLEEDAYGVQIFGDFTTIFPLLSAFVLGA